ncbi:hypothetical protein SDC9_91775 [bioreactor metagenome]|uniref:Uncharacterized protein n=1 Tax=bioreactor metagenome TaxID=1076179 RepID=A0A644ZVU1_9ZZZZ
MDILGEEAELGHFRIESVYQLLSADAVYRDAAILNIFRDIALQLCFGVLGVPGDEGAVVGGDICLHVIQHGGKVLALAFGGKEQGMRPSRSDEFHRSIDLRRLMPPSGLSRFWGCVLLRAVFLEKAQDAPFFLQHSNTSFAIFSISLRSVRLSLRDRSASRFPARY